VALDHLIVIGASAGGFDALVRMAADLPRALPAAVCVVLHVSPESPGILAQAVERAGALPAETAVDGRRLEAQHIFIAPADHHLIVEPGVLRITRGPKENGFRPAIDPLFRSAAQVYGPRVIGVVLTGFLDDGTAGLWAVKRLGGVAVVQDPADAVAPSMPRSALAHVEIDYSVPLQELTRLLVRLTATAVQERRVHSGPLDIEVDIARARNAREAGIERLGEPSAFACPECHGVLRRITEGNYARFRCHTGHAYSVPSLVAAADHGTAEALWNAIRALDERGRMLLHLCTHASSDDRTAELRHAAAQAFDDSEKLREIAERRGAHGRTADRDP